MPFKPDFIEVLKRYARLPFTNTKEALKLKRLEEAASATGAHRIMEENRLLKFEKEELEMKIDN